MPEESVTVGRRERKKAATRKAISNAATMLFLERGFNEVSIREIAEEADVSPTTVFAHFPQKEALIFDEDDDQRERIVAAVRDRPAGMSVTKALHDYFSDELSDMGEYGDEAIRRFMGLVEQTPALRDYAQRMWLRHADAVADAIGADFGLAEPTIEIRAYARFVIQIQLMVLDASDTRGIIDAGFALLDRGWEQYESKHARKF
jgi:AcrR family transcriptional regulator